VSVVVTVPVAVLVEIVVVVTVAVFVTVAVLVTVAGAAPSMEAPMAVTVTVPVTVAVAVPVALIELVTVPVAVCTLVELNVTVTVLVEVAVGDPPEPVFPPLPCGAEVLPPLPLLPPEDVTVVFVCVAVLVGLLFVPELFRAHALTKARARRKCFIVFSGTGAGGVNPYAPQTRQSVNVRNVRKLFWR
jgi:hypothetical protein